MSEVPLYDHGRRGLFCNTADRVHDLVKYAIRTKAFGNMAHMRYAFGRGAGRDTVRVRERQ